MLVTDAKYYNNWGKIITWKIPIDMVAVIFAKKLIKKYLHNKSIDKAYPNQDGTYTINNVQISRIRENSIVFREKEMTKVYETYYMLRFGVPLTNILECNKDDIFLPYIKYERDDNGNIVFHEGYRRNILGGKEIIKKYELGELQTIKITKWAYENCYLKAVERILEDWGEYIKGLIDIETDIPYYKYNPNIKFIEKIKRDIHEKNIKKSDNEMGSKKYDEKEEIYNIQDSNELHQQGNNIKEEVNRVIYYCDGSGNLFSGDKRSETGHYSVIIPATGEKWKKREDRLTNNEAETKAFIACCVIALDRGDKHIEICGDSQNVIKWCMKRRQMGEVNFQTNMMNVANNRWKTNKPEIAELIDKLVFVMNKLDLVVLTYIDRSKNFAHAV